MVNAGYRRSRGSIGIYGTIEDVSLFSHGGSGYIFYPALSMVRNGSLRATHDDTRRIRITE